MMEVIIELEEKLVEAELEHIAENEAGDDW